MQRPATPGFRLGLIGYPLGHSLSPRLHAAALRQFGMKGDYSLFPVHPDDSPGLKELLARLRSGELHGLNVTIPHKQNVIPYLDEMTPTAESIGAVNTIYFRDNKLTGDNTDARGFLLDLTRFLETISSPATDESGARAKSVLVLGAGGSARAVVYALVSDGWDVTIAARRPEQARELAARLDHPEIRIANLRFSNIDLSSISLIVNTTPLGMTPNVDRSPWPEKFPFPKNAAIYDLVYNPRETKLVQDACSQGLSATTGLGMLIEQAALSFERWTGCKPTFDIMFDAVHETARQ